MGKHPLIPVKFSTFTSGSKTGMGLLNNRFSEADQLFVDAMSFLSAGDVSKAAKSLVHITERFEGYSKAWNELGKILLYKLEDAEGAAECFKKAIDSDPSYAPAYIAYAEALFALEKFAEMNAILNQANELKGVRKDFVLQKSAMLMESQGRYEEAIDAYKKALLASFSDEEILKCENGIKRCLAKMKYL